MPKINFLTSFSNWFRWKERECIPDINLQGVYLIAKFKKVPKGSANAKNKYIIYIGETCKKLSNRLIKFDNAAFRGGHKHSGGVRYKKTYKDKGADLFVAVRVVEKRDLSHSFIKYFERKLIYEYAIKYGKQPKLNKE